jgi:hypothetical protein
MNSARSEVRERGRSGVLVFSLSVCRRRCDDEHPAATDPRRSAMNRILGECARPVMRRPVPKLRVRAPGRAAEEE